ncbi:hypothetical protein MATR_29170 [Marivirga tractuosa]|uniref:Uncharacterized protein n=1 Tax=Marivirga tractuosa (strain ATCC 23168 / DSM 4126 / NBRC 15989 / NCIMB 1408 / VKM B-1430 / H-43) TaxID=643867 RepID=E4TW16_MARTH|nr:hypothetical protein Ftrac_3260 [Marivirga tractuosa DSM 4126]BDD16092.1 hypothetical protein MATR_29170 [Marivirga tractuosa]
MIIVLSWICIFQSGAFSINAQSILIADSLYSVKNYDLAAVYYEKAIYQVDNSQDYNDYLWRLANLYRESQDFNKSIKTLERIRRAMLNDSVKSELFYQISFAYFMMDQYSKSYFNLLQYKSLDFKRSREDVLLLETLLYAKMGKWEKCEEAYYAYTKDTTKSSSDFFGDMKAVKRKSPEKAENLSYLLPGAGQIYAGKPIRGLTSFTIQTGLLAFAAYNFLNGYYFSGTFTGVSLFYVFYMGGARHAGYLAENYNEAQNEKAYNLLLNRIEENKKGH